MIRVFPLAVFLLTSPSFGFKEKDDWNRIQSIAKAHYDIIMLLIEGKEYDKVVAESQKLFSLDFPESKEDLVFESTQNIADSLRHCERFDLAHQVINNALRIVRSNLWKASLYEEKAFTFEKEGKRNEALDFFRRAQQLKQVQP